jgi:hemerythrin superfamily protein
MPSSSSKPAAPDAITLLAADHREVDALFEAFEAAAADERKAIADQICLALTVHARIEEEILYPAAREATGETRLLDEATVEHMGAKTLVAQIETMLPDHPLFAAHVSVLAEQVRHHVEEEEGELFPKLQESGLDLDALGAALAERKAVLLGAVATAAA